jgi:hypothetical protein
MAGERITLERLMEHLRVLDEDGLSVVYDFVEFLVQKRVKKTPGLIDALRERACASVTLEQVRADLSTIRGSLADAVIQLRQERG